MKSSQTKGRALAWAVVVAILLTAVSCQTTVIDFQGDATPATHKAQKPEESRVQSSVVIGLISLSKPVVSPCERPHQVVVRRSILDQAIHFFVGGIYTTRRVDIHCDGQ